MKADGLEDDPYDGKRYQCPDSATDLCLVLPSLVFGHAQQRISAVIIGPISKQLPHTIRCCVGAGGPSSPPHTGDGCRSQRMIPTNDWCAPREPIPVRSLGARGDRSNQACRPWRPLMTQSRSNADGLWVDAADLVRGTAHIRNRASAEARSTIAWISNPAPLSAWCRPSRWLMTLLTCSRSS